MIGLSASSTSFLRHNGTKRWPQFSIALSTDAFQTSTKPRDSNDGNDETLPASEDRGVIDFFRQFLPASSSGSCETIPPQHQPMAVLQTRYSTVQHKIDKQAPHKSIKTWFVDTTVGDKHDLWWRSEIRVPMDVRDEWGLCSDCYSSGELSLTRCERNVLDTSQEDILACLCGEYKTMALGRDGTGETTTTTYFKSKKAAQKSAALNLLLELDLGSVRSAEESGEHILDSLDKLDGIDNDNVERSARFQLENMKYIGQLKDPDGALLSNSNPCLFQCIALVKDNQCHERDCIIEIKSNFESKLDSAFIDALNQMRSKLMERNATEYDMHLLALTMKELNPQQIEYEKAMPKWASTKVDGAFPLYLHELEFDLVNNNHRIPLSEAIGLDKNAATRIGLVCGSPLDGELSSRFALKPSSCLDENIRVLMRCKQTITKSEMMKQKQQVSYECGMKENQDPVLLLKCFNKILIEKGKEYGIGPKIEMDKLLEEATNKNPKYLFVPLCNSGEDHSLGCEIDWTVVIDVLCNRSSPVLYSDNPKKMTEQSVLRNRFLTQPIGFKQRLFVMRPTNTELDILPDEVVSQLPHHACRTSSETYVRYCSQLWSGQSDDLIHTHLMNMLTYNKHEMTLFHRRHGSEISTSAPKQPHNNSISNSLAFHGLLMPDLTYALPMPRDVLYLCQYASTFMAKLERADLFRSVASRLTEFQDISSLSCGIKPSTASTHANMVEVIEKATSICGTSTTREDERLETLGDAVLLYFIVMNLFSKIPSIDDVHDILDLFGEVIRLECKNKCLVIAGNFIGLPHVISVPNESTIWSRSGPKLTQLVPRQVADKAESLLGAAYLLDNTGYMSLGLLNEFGETLESTILRKTTSRDDASWLAVKRTCMCEGYPFHEHSTWRKRLDDVWKTLQDHHQVLSVIQSKANNLCQILAKPTECHSEFIRVQSDPIASLLLHCAIFDDSLEDQGSDYMESLDELARLRDVLFNVGNASLQLSIVKEIYNLYPTATSGDIHLFKTSTSSHDVLAYMMVKIGFTSCLYDEHANATSEMRDSVHEADKIGAQHWEANEGWIIPGGQHEFQRRIKSVYSGVSHVAQVEAHYYGLAAGRLWSMQKLPESTTNDLQFSMKTIVGSLVLIFGVDEAWNILRPFFLEIMLISPDEMRNRFKGVSDLTSNYQKGKR